MPAGSRQLVLAVVFLAVILAGSLPECEAADRETAADLYIVAPDFQVAGCSNLLPLEATLRAVAIEVCAGGVRTVYVPVNQKDTLGESAYPRLELALPGPSSQGKWRVILKKSATDSVELAQVELDRKNWERLTKTVSAARDAVVLAVVGALVEVGAEGV
ncbi:MAG: hypothetical protein J7M19_07550 [Planctomycetes bacterium]|nr:hypothetical protein [Planctomycetota bacterium]